MKNALWKFIDTRATFCFPEANRLNTLYLPLCNNSPIMSSLTPDLHGDIKTDFNSFLLQPVSRADLSNLKSSRNFWLYINPQKIWSATGVSKDIATKDKDKFSLEAGLLWQKITRENRQIGLKAEITSFVPASNDPVEIMQVAITNITSKNIKFIPTAAIPLFARSAHNLHDHRHVTSLLQRTKREKFGVVVTPTLIFDESGHRKNPTSYFVWGTDEKGLAPEYLYPTYAEFAGEGTDLEAPDAVWKNKPPAKIENSQGQETMAGLRFQSRLLKPRQSYTYIILMGIVKDKAQIKALWEKFNTAAKIQESLEKNKIYWQNKGTEIDFRTGDRNLDCWLKWVNIQPTLRRIFGCSFLPDFDYGKGGRGWRDLWQDRLSLVLNNPKEVRPLMVSNFAGVRSDGSHATIIGQKPGEFIADRNNISRVWMDHGVWPLITTHLYLHQTGDFTILAEETSYFRDPQLCRGKEKDANWKPADGKNLKTRNKEVYKGSILEHILVENLVPFFNVGPHNHILLEGADWNDGLDMASKNGESVAFSCMYAQNLHSLCEIIARIDEEKIPVLKELALLLDSLSPEKLDYSDIQAKQKLLSRYSQSTKYEVSGEKIFLPKEELIRDLKRKADWMYEHIRSTEWLKEGFYNGYYDDRQQRVEGNIRGGLRMTLAGQAFAVMSGVATLEQAKILFESACRYLKDKKLGGFRLNTDFQEEQLNLGRAFSFVYGEKENGAFFNHMAVIFAYALYKQGFARQGYEVLSSIYRMALDTQKSKIYPCIPEYFNAAGRGMYSYLTGSASWFIFTFLTQVCGIRGEYGDLMIEPKLTAEQFKVKSPVCVNTRFADKNIAVKFLNPNSKDFGDYALRKITFNQKEFILKPAAKCFILARSEFLALAQEENILEVLLD